MVANFILSLGAVLLLGTGVALAEDAPAKKGAGEHRAEMFMNRDLNKDGSISTDEMGQAAGNMFDQIDVNGDGQLSREEMDGHHMKRRAEREDARQRKHFDELDADADGNVSRDEFVSKMNEHSSRADMNGDGKVTKEEMEARRKKMEERMKERREEARKEGRTPPVEKAPQPVPAEETKSGEPPAQAE